MVKYAGSEWGVVLDDIGSMDVYETREEAEIARQHSKDQLIPLVRIDYLIVKGWGEE